MTLRELQPTHDEMELKAANATTTPKIFLEPWLWVLRIRGGKRHNVTGAAVTMIKARGTNRRQGMRYGGAGSRKRCVRGSGLSRKRWREFAGVRKMTTEPTIRFSREHDQVDQILRGPDLTDRMRPSECLGRRTGAYYWPGPLAEHWNWSTQLASAATPNQEVLEKCHFLPLLIIK
ncbi:hypothetical protein TRIUR3_29417 [Triticum urartu]|uniref:Uncharacterized protein n=1 Tax=Triticum urartu TaxID=4572 RepID=M7YLM6_TRIUA|nr:hypothetical protein TRIUR3_29417 [Triticum urartu]